MNFLSHNGPEFIRGDVKKWCESQVNSEIESPVVAEKKEWGTEILRGIQSAYRWQNHGQQLSKNKHEEELSCL